MSIGTMAIELRVFKKKKKEKEKKNMDKMRKTFLGIIFTFGALSYVSSRKRRKRQRRKNMDKMGKTFLGIIFTFGALLLKFLVYF